MTRTDVQNKKKSIENSRSFFHDLTLYIYVYTYTHMYIAEANSVAFRGWPSVPGIMGCPTLSSMRAPQK